MMDRSYTIYTQVHTRTFVTLPVLTRGSHRRSRKSGGSKSAWKLWQKYSELPRSDWGRLLLTRVGSTHLIISENRNHPVSLPHRANKCQAAKIYIRPDKIQPQIPQQTSSFMKKYTVYITNGNIPKHKVGTHPRFVVSKVPTTIKIYIYLYLYICSS